MRDAERETLARERSDLGPLRRVPLCFLALEQVAVEEAVRWKEKKGVGQRPVGRYEREEQGREENMQAKVPEELPAVSECIVRGG
jgi:hypothetical protein